jgi:hypothetical protein
MRLPRFTAFLLAVGLAACTTEIPKSAITQAPAVTFAGRTGKIALAPVINQLPQRHPIGTYFRNLDCWVWVRPVMDSDFPATPQLAEPIRAALTAAKLTLVPGEPADVAAASGADFLLVAKVPEAHVDMCLNNVWNEGPTDVDAQVAVSWQLWSVIDRKVVAESTTTGTAHASDPSDRIDAGVFAGLTEATRQWLQIATVQQALTFGRVAAPAVAPGGATVVGAAPPAPAAAPVHPTAVLGAILVPVRSARPDSAGIDAAAAKAAVLPSASGAVVVVGDGYLLGSTALIGEGILETVSLPGGRKATVRVIRKDAETGIVLLRTDETLPLGLPLHPRRVAPGDKVSGVGPSGIVAGDVVATKATGGADKVRLPGAWVGGPVLDEAGNVIGILQPGGGWLPIGRAFRALELGAQMTDE